MSLVRWDPFADVNTLFDRLMPRGFLRLQFALGGNGRKLEWSARFPWSV
jgi:hypothetical protein